MGTPDFVVPVLKALAENQYVNIVSVYTRPPRPRSRGKQTQLSPVHQAAFDMNLSIRTPHNFKERKDIDDFSSLELDVAVVAGYGMILPDSILFSPRYGCINIHPSLLPRWRGPSPVQYAIWNGDERTGVCIMKLDKKMDTGPIISVEGVDIEPDETTESLNNKVWPLGAKMVSEVLKTLSQKGNIPATPQHSEGATYSRLFQKEEGRVDWTKSAKVIERQVRALNPWPGTWCETASGKRIKILSAVTISSIAKGRVPGEIIDSNGHITCGEDTVLSLVTVQPENKKPMGANAAFQGGYVKQGEILE